MSWLLRGERELYKIFQNTALTLIGGHTQRETTGKCQNGV